MKSEHRHELAENDLSKLLVRWGEKFDEHANTILSVLIVITLLAAALIYWTRTSSNRSALGWTDLTNASSPEDYQAVAETYAGSPVSQWATLRAGDGFLNEGIRLSLTDRSASNERLEQAKDFYQSLLDSSAPAELREQALNGYAITLEATSNGDTSDAIAAYESLLKQFPETRFKVFANERISQLKTGRVQDFYAWFSRLDPKPADLPMPDDGSKTTVDNLPELPEGMDKDGDDSNPFLPKPDDEKANDEKADSEKSDSEKTNNEKADDETTETSKASDAKTPEPEAGDVKETSEADEGSPASEESSESEASQSPTE